VQVKPCKNHDFLKKKPLSWNTTQKNGKPKLFQKSQYTNIDLAKYKKEVFIMKIKPKLNYVLLGTNIKLNKNKVYNTIKATNQPESIEKEKIFVLIKGDSFLLEKGEYIIVEK